MTSNENNGQFNDDPEGFDPAEEDFNDEAYGDDAAGEDAFADEDWDSFDDQVDPDGDGEQAGAPAKKKSGNFNKIVIGIAVLAGAGLFLMQMGKGPATNPAPAPAPEMVASTPEQPALAPMPAPAAPPPPPIEQAGSQPGPSEGGFLNSSDNLAALERDIAESYSETELISGAPEDAEEAMTPPMPNSITPETAPLATAEAPIRMPNANDLLKQPALAERAETVPAMPEQSAAPADTLLSGAPAPSVPAPAPALAAGPVGAPAVTALSEKMDQLLNRLDRMEAELADLKGAVAVRDDSADLTALQKSVQALEKKIAAQPAAAVNKAADPAPQRAASPEDAEAEAFVPQKPQILGAAPAAKPAPSRASPTAQPKAAPQWVLKGAQPGRAMVARPGESDMRSVAVGDTLSGIGRITAISYQNGRWQIQGTQGVIQQ